MFDFQIDHVTMCAVINMAWFSHYFLNTGWFVQKCAFLAVREARTWKTGNVYLIQRSKGFNLLHTEIICVFVYYSSIQSSFCQNVLAEKFCWIAVPTPRSERYLNFPAILKSKLIVTERGEIY